MHKGEALNKRDLGMLLSLSQWLSAAAASAEAEDSASSPLSVSVTFSVLGNLATP
jgi:manganese/iron transport system substrate-binding protein